VTQLRTAQLDRPEGGLDGARRLEAVAIPDRAVRSSAFVTSPAELLEDDLLDHGLEGEAHRQAGDLLDRAHHIAAAGEQLVDLCTDGLGGRYSWCHGCRSSFVDLLVSGEPTPVARLHQGPDATPDPPGWSWVRRARDPPRSHTAARLDAPRLSREAPRATLRAPAPRGAARATGGVPPPCPISGAKGGARGREATPSFPPGAGRNAAQSRESGGAGDGNRTRMTSLEGWDSAIELRPRRRGGGI